MNHFVCKSPYIVIACGGTGGHFFPGVAVSNALRERGFSSLLVVSDKAVDRASVAGLVDQPYLTLSSEAFSRKSPARFFRSQWNDYQDVLALYRRSKPSGVLAMGGFASAAPVLAAKRIGIPVFLHEANTIVGRANRRLGWFSDTLFTGFPSTLTQRSRRGSLFTGTPVRESIRKKDSRESRLELGLDPDRCTLLIMGGSQGALAINETVLNGLDHLSQLEPALQFIHLTGGHLNSELERAYRERGLKACVLPFTNQMPQILDAATIAISRSGASSMAEFAAMELPSILIPYPFAADNHQMSNARAFETTGAAVVLTQTELCIETLVGLLRRLLSNPHRMTAMRQALKHWHSDQAASLIADRIIQRIRQIEISNPNRNPFQKATAESPESRGCSELSHTKPVKAC